jgi:prolyl oligopeptidase
MEWDKLVDTFDAAHEVLVRLPFLSTHGFGCLLENLILALYLTHGRLANDGSKLYIRTNEDAPQYKIVTLDMADEKRERKVIIPEDKDTHLEDVVPVNNDTFVVVYKRNVSLQYLLTALVLH